MKQVTSMPGAGLFRSVTVVIIFSVCVALFLVYSQDISNKTNRIAREKVISEINVALSMLLFQSTITGSLKKLPKLDRKNPFIVLSGKDYQPPRDYVGQLKVSEMPVAIGWYFDESQQNIFYWDGKSREYQYQLRFKYHDTNRDGNFDPASDFIESLTMVRQ
jgi:hypothetical protein